MITNFQTTYFYCAECSHPLTVDTESINKVRVTPCPNCVEREDLDTLKEALRLIQTTVDHNLGGNDNE